MVLKEKFCLVLDPNKAELRIRLNWVSFHMSNMALKDALQKCGELEDVTREIWKVGRLQGN